MLPSKEKCAFMNLISVTNIYVELSEQFVYSFLKCVIKLYLVIFKYFKTQSRFVIVIN